MSVGDGVPFGVGVAVDAGVSVGDGVPFGVGVAVDAGVSVGDGVPFGSGVGVGIVDDVTCTEPSPQVDGMSSP